MKFAVYAGHGGADPGAVGVNKREEEDLTLELMKLTTDVLQNSGHTVINNRTSDVNRDISADARKANSNKVDAVLEFHFDAASASAQGTTGFYCDGAADSKKLAQCVNDELDNFFKDRQIKPDTSTRHGRLGILRETNAPATLQEVAFITNAADVATYDAKKNQIAEAAARGLLKYFGLSLKSTTNSNPAAIQGTVTDVAPLLPKAQFKGQTPIRKWKSGVNIQVRKHSDYWYKASVEVSSKWVTGYIYRAHLKNVKPVKGTDKFTATTVGQAIWWDNDKLNGGEVLYYKPGTKMSHYGAVKGLYSAWFSKQNKKFYTTTYWLDK
ncbi:N-acetylmuramoyl-L-alanine amidase [Listeria ilorinensis]|uniref:N-acetylmuramoyl-L-alanine amidase n=1 Tax=Listeria ilorinensis TaxID=2867439 RepID=UPI001EF44836|nr:N-acetylmuramoyl-L-alanine amidase [Listeria ilorinensis]